MKNRICILIILLLPLFCVSQKRGAVWCFGDSALVNFSDTSNITNGISSAKSRGSCASVSDSAGNLLFYSTYNTDIWVAGGPPFQNGAIFNKFHNVMDNGDSIVMQGWYNEVVIITNPANINEYYVFSIGVTASNKQGLWYSIVDISANGGLGIVTQKNVQLQSFMQVDCLTAIKHGNGRDWWILFRRWKNSPLAPNNEFHSYLVSPAGITNYNVQHIGSIQSTGFGGFAFTNDGNGFAYFNPQGLLELYNFDRCTGVISNPVNIHTESLQAPYETYWGGAFSPSGKLLFISKLPYSSSSTSDTSRLYQFDITAPNIAASADTLWETPFMLQMGQLKLASDGKIYQSNNYYGVYPYPDTTYNMYNMNLSVINSPDSLGVACNLQPYSFYLGGARTYYGLPNNPDYDMPRLQGSPCDTVLFTNLTPVPSPRGEVLQATYVRDWQKLFVNAQHLKGTTYTLTVTDITGRQVYVERGERRVAGGYFTIDLDCSSFSNGMYIVILTTNKEQLSKKFVKN